LFPIKTFLIYLLKEKTRQKKPPMFSRIFKDYLPFVCILYILWKSECEKRQTQSAIN